MLYIGNKQAEDHTDKCSVWTGIEMQRKHIQGVSHAREGFSTKASASFIICTAQTPQYLLSTDLASEQDFTLDSNTVLKWHIVQKLSKMSFS